ncbi:ABC transporter ATP-binding protein [Bordetella pseudohinzii]|uniref:Glutamine transport ATP-binding protein GlnQ n=1 Tax=Bordetella pseudohinzii TaxID=1331258 RepID=A0A0J6C675_9BORD|nr:high-affinity branched-chain amino acid ABC transporter ATP-binding protein LivG [Bordetella pseudohinzii]KMM26231.1 leucine/isoleucine/valine transporter ATP-binding subunit [Bordetella pseudohinzii]KXA75693.1 high-affinity branched-chain amino acid ABC transporter ATP-binding protein LivG [Bordetella pseudohinzii]KXA76144.1 high-affinity branched-chain amino acid ABC transporter ATP-binding protein LivG [Bordetella pseudohinzii]CUI50892.1 Glutamine transport ATP-binding protein GlnQ [Borde
MLEVKGLTRYFGGVAAVQDVSFQVREGDVHAVIGPNGAGKTTLFNLISGVYAPSAGDILLDRKPVGGMAPEQLARRGLSRTFQNLQVCMNMTARENVMLGAHLRQHAGLVAGLMGWTRAADRRLAGEALAWMEMAGVAEYHAHHASQLSFGALKRLEIARALASEPRLLLLDEPAAGLNDSETAELTRLIRRIAETGITILLVEHDMRLVMEISNRILVLDHGRRLAEGSAQEIRADEKVIQAYLGASSDAE